MATSKGRQKYRFFFQMKDGRVVNSNNEKCHNGTENQYQIMKKAIIAKTKNNKN